MQTRTTAGELANLEKLTAATYAVPEGEEHLYHVLQETKKYDADTGQKRTKPRVQKYGKKIFESNVYSSNKKRKMSIVILHDPNKWSRENAEKVKQAEAQREERAETRKAKEREAMKAEILAELGQVQSPAPAVDPAIELQMLQLKAQIAADEKAAAELNLKAQAAAKVQEVQEPPAKEKPAKGKTAGK